MLKSLRIVFTAAFGATLFATAFYMLVVVKAVMSTLEDGRPQPMSVYRYEARLSNGELLRTDEGWVMEFDSEEAASKYAREYEAADRKDELARSKHQQRARR